MEDSKTTTAQEENRPHHLLDSIGGLASVIKGALQQILDKEFEGFMEDVLNSLCEDPSLLTFLSFPGPIWESIHTSNAIEGFNSKLRRETRKRISLNTLDNGIFRMAQSCPGYNSSTRRRRISGFERLTDEELKALGMQR